MMKNLSTILLLFLSQLCSSQVSENIELLYHWNDTTIEMNFRNSRFSDVWGFEYNDNEYAVLGSTFGTHVFDVTFPNQVYEVDRKPGANQGYGVNHRDYKVYDHYLYGVCDEGASTLQIFDLNFLPDSLHKVYDESIFFNRAHTIFIDEDLGILYVNGTPEHSLTLLSLSNPTAPELIAYFDEVPYVHDMYLRDNIGYLNCGNGVYVVDFSNPQSPEFLGSLTDYPDQGYNHSGWLNENGDTYVFCDETYGSEVKICDVSDLNDIQIVASVSSGVSVNSVAHNAFIKGDYLYIAYYNDGLQVFDISAPTAPFRVGYYDTFLPSQDDDFRGAWGVYPFLPSGNVLIGDRNSGLYVVHINPPVSVGEAAITDTMVKVFPNPTASTITIELFLNSAKTITYSLVDPLGKLVMKSTDKTFPQGHHSLSLNANFVDDNHAIYFLKIQIDDEVIVKKIFVEK